MTTHTCQCGAAFTADPAGRLRHQMIHGHRPTVRGTLPPRGAA